MPAIAESCVEIPTASPALQLLHDFLMKDWNVRTINAFYPFTGTASISIHFFPLRGRSILPLDHLSTRILLFSNAYEIEDAYVCCTTPRLLGMSWG